MEKSKLLNIVGDKYGRLTVIKEVERKSQYVRQFLCECECGEDIVVQMNNLRNGKTKSCGCLQKERVKEAVELDLKGERFGKLTVIDKTDDAWDDAHNFWKCRCDCGNEIVKTSTQLSSRKFMMCKECTLEETRKMKQKK